jgi:hypothetical protein
MQLQKCQMALTISYYYRCLDELFYEADYDERYYPACERIGIMMYSFLFGVTIVLGVQVFCSLVFVFRKPRTFTTKDMEAGVVVMMPCYNEGPHELQKTIDSVVMTKVRHRRRVYLSSVFFFVLALILNRVRFCSTPKRIEL